MKKLWFVLLLLFTVMFAGCFGSHKDDGLHPAIDKTKKVKIGIVQIETHGALDAARQGFTNKLKDAGFRDQENIEIMYLNPEGDPNNLEMMARKAVEKNDLVLAVATPAAIAVKAAAKNMGKKIPILFTAVTDPAKDKLVKSMIDPGGRITGTSDMNPVKEQIQLIKQIDSNISKLGILYTAKETNSKTQADMAEEEAKKQGLEVKIGMVQGAQDIRDVLRDLINKTDVIYIPTDNNLAKNMGFVAQIANDAKIPVICGEENEVKAGGLITLGINYEKLGEMTGEMAVRIIEGEQAKDLPVQSLGLDECDLAVNIDTMNKIGITIPDNILDKARHIETNPVG